ncbi:MAG TPA: DUF6352 family protein [Usitatibacter sp.]|nr:DUF6352 family protein [Usitatibacter sp.]
MPQDFWASSGHRDLQRTQDGLVATDAWLARLVARAELLPPDDAGPRERAMHARLASNPRAVVSAAALADIEDADARENWTEFLRFRDRVLAFATLEACYRDLFHRPVVDLAPPFVDALAEAIVRDLLEGTDDPWLCRAGEMLFRRQRIAAEGGHLLAADDETIQVFAETGGFGAVGRLLRQQNTPTPAVKMDVLTRENAPLYFMRDELHAFVLDLAPDGAGAASLARVIERWVARMAGVEVTIEPRGRIDDERWRWHVGLDVESSRLLDMLYRGETVDAAELERMVLLFRLEFHDPGDVLPEMAGRPVYLGLACRPDRVLKVKPQNLILNLPLPRSH